MFIVLLVKLFMVCCWVESAQVALSAITMRLSVFHVQSKLSISPAIDLRHVSVMVCLACGFVCVAKCNNHGLYMILLSCITVIAAYHMSIWYLSHCYLLCYSISSEVFAGFREGLWHMGQSCE